MQDNVYKSLYNDTATLKDTLGFEPYVKAIAEFLTDVETVAPITLSIEGEWGCGKSSFMKQLKKEIETKNNPKRGRKEYFTIWFNGWRYEKEDFLWAAFALNLIDQLSTQLSWRLRQLAKMKLIWLRLKLKWKTDKEILLHIFLRISFIFILFLLCIFIIFYIPTLTDYLFSHSTNTLTSVSPFTDPVFFILSLINFSNTNSVISTNSLNLPNSTDLVDYKFRTSINILLMLAGIIGLMLQSIYLLKEIKNFVGKPFDFNKIISNSNYSEHISFIEYLHADFDKIIKAYAGNSKVYIFVDDLDRCETPKAAELMQALNLMISDEANVFFTIGIDRKVISAAFAAKHEKVYKYLNNDGLGYGYNFIEKFIQLPFKVPIPKNKDFKEFLKPQKKGYQKSKWSFKDIRELYFKVKKSSLVQRITRSVDSNQTNSKSSNENVEKIAIKPSGEKPNEETKENMGKNSNGTTDKDKKYMNDYDCAENSEEFENILIMVSASLDRNPRRIKQFYNLFRFQKIIGYRTGFFSYSGNIKPQNRWNCKKLAKFVAISIKWPSLISALASNETLLDNLQKYALKAEIEEIFLKKTFGDQQLIELLRYNSEENDNLNMDQWIHDQKLIGLLREGCIEENVISQNIVEYVLLDLDYSKLLQISPILTNIEENTSKISSVIPNEIKFVTISAGKLTMGSPIGEAGRNPDEEQKHEVNITKPFELGIFPVTQRQWKAVMGYNPSHFRGEDRPVESVTWYDVQAFIRKLNKIEGADRYRLPTEAEWEYACRAGTITRYSFGDDDSELGEYGWYDKNSGSETHIVGRMKHNNWSLYDMHGNVSEWCQDVYTPDYNLPPPNVGELENESSQYRVRRGGAWGRDASSCRSAARDKDLPDFSRDALGFRLVREI